MQGIQLGGGRYVDALITKLEQALDFMPVKHMCDRLTELERLNALIGVRLMTVPVSGIREPSTPDRLPEVSETA